MNDTLNRVSAAAIQLLLEIGPIGVRTNPELTKKSIEIFHIDPREKEENGEIAIEIVLFPTEEIIYWLEGDQFPETEWIDFIDTVHGKNKAE
jgi:hypothetical protein